MTMKTKRGLAIGSGTALCAALAILIASRFAPEPTAVAPIILEANSEPTIKVEMPAVTRSETTAVKPENTAPSTTAATVSTPIESDPDKESEQFIEDGGIEIEQNFPEPEKLIEPPAPPIIEDEEMLTNPDTEPIYEPAQTTVTAAENPTNPNVNHAMHGQTKDGMIFINGFGWVVDNGGGGRSEYDDEMYENGNKIGYFG